MLTTTIEDELEQAVDRLERAMVAEARWLDLRDRMGRLYARYNPEQDLIEIRAKGHTETFHLEQYRQIRG